MPLAEGHKLMPTTVRFIARNSNTDCCVQASLCIREVFRYMRSRELSAVAVIEQEHVLGVIAGRDIVRRVVLEDMNLAAVRARDIMSSPVYSVSSEEHYEVAMAMMVEHDLRQLVVLDANEAFLGFLTATEMLQMQLDSSRALVGKLNDAYYAPSYPSKQALRRRAEADGRNGRK
ncbi:MAG: CBS domain-containing protein [Myxococcales bacterium]|jgi:predicted transcriptional regulator